VGFRPWVYRLATARGLAGFVLNDAGGVVIEVEGPAERVADFLAALGPGGDPTAPPLARIADIEAAAIEPVGEAAFVIRASDESLAAATQVSPDMAICGDCLRELLDPADRRFRYPFINCTNCGPRYSIILDVPYDRPRTTMARFQMCPDCRREYEDPADRRFHAQPNACPVCGPKLALYDAAGKPVEHGDPVAFVREQLLAGKIVVLKGLTGYHLACDARSEAAVAELRRRKRRDQKPLALMVGEPAQAGELVELDAASRQLLEAPERPIVLIQRAAGSQVAPSVAPRSRYLGVMLPYAPVHYLLFDKTKTASPSNAGGFKSKSKNNDGNDKMPPLVMTSANVSEEPMCRGNEETVARMSGIADWYLLHDRDIQTVCDDSVAMVQLGSPVIIRRARGYAPRPLPLGAPAPGETILAVGPELKNCVCLTRGGEAFVSQHIGDLKNPLAVGYFEETIRKLERLLEVTPTVVAHDLHPAYQSTRYARRRPGVRLLAVQHHHAHVASAMAEHQLNEPVIGLAMDGTGYGTDGRSWGSEFLLVRPDGTFDRLGHLDYVALPGGDAAIEKTVRVAYAHLLAAFGDQADEVAARLLPGTSAADRAVWRRMIEREVNSPLACGLGRLFDAASALLGVATESSYEGQAAIELETAAATATTETTTASPSSAGGLKSNDNGNTKRKTTLTAAAAKSASALHDDNDKFRYEIAMAQDGATFTISPAPLIRDLVAAREAGRPVGKIAVAFHNTVTAILLDGAGVCRTITGVRRVALAGGCFLNRYVVERLVPKLEAAGFVVYRHREVSPGDGGIALGQTEVGRQRLAAGTF
jgi:hydrogenase maturation protein HypF